MTIVLWLFFCIMVGFFATRKGRSGIAWFFIAFLISPLFSGIILALLKDLSQENKIEQIKKETEKLEDRIATDEKMNELKFKEIESSVRNGTSLSSSSPLRLLEDSMKECPICGQLINANAIKCKYCKNDISDENLIICPYCFEKTLKNNEYCVHCDSKILNI